MHNIFFPCICVGLSGTNYMGTLDMGTGTAINNLYEYARLIIVHGFIADELYALLCDCIAICAIELSPL